MASVHGAGLMMLPVLLAQPGHSSFMTHAAVHTIGSPHLPTSILVLAVVVHTMSLLVIAGGLALLFYETYEKVGLKFLYHAWINFDLLWAIALLTARMPGVASLKNGFLHAVRAAGPNPNALLNLSHGFIVARS